jgi:ketosteroid isomerase-like protein
VAELEGRGDVAYARGSYSMKIAVPGAPAPVDEKGKYVEIWRRQADGSWKLARDIFNSDLPLPTAAPAPAENQR